MEDIETTAGSAEVLIPPSLREGDKVVILSPSGIIKPQFVYNALPVLQAQGWEPYVMPHALGRSGTYSGTADERYSDLEAALTDPEVRAILCARGGYGAVHLLERLDKLPLRDDPKWIIGYSDISALHALMAKHGIASIHAPMAKHLATYEGNDDDAQALFEILSGRRMTYDIPPHPYNRFGEAEGRLCGGNLAVLAGLINTPFDLLQPDTIWFIEDISEPVYKVERIMYQLKLSGVLGRLKGLIVGAFTEYSPDIDGVKMEDMIHRMVAEYGYPVAFDVPVGHVEHNLPLIESAPVKLSVSSEGAVIEQ